MSAPIRLLLVFGGRSSEHEISIRSAREVIAAVDASRISLELLGIRRDGGMRAGASATSLEQILEDGAPVEHWGQVNADVVFPLLHGPYGEDGTIQGALELAGLPFVGSGVAASAACMDKIMLKRIASGIGIPVVDGIDLFEGDVDHAIEDSTARVLREVGTPCFVKPANQGSSIGISRVDEVDGLPAALRHARAFDSRILVERALDVEEFEVGVLGSGDGHTVISPPGHLKVPDGQWYDYDNKYQNDSVHTQIPASIEPSLAMTMQAAARDIFRATGCHGLARVDFLVEREHRRCYLNEVNTMPGFTSISMYPRLLGATGIDYPSLIVRLCELALQRADDRARLSITP